MLWTIELCESGMEFRVPQPLRRKVRGFSRFASREIAFIPWVIGITSPRRTPNPTLVLFSFFLHPVSRRIRYHGVPISAYHPHKHLF